MGRTACSEPQCLYKGDLYLTLPASALRAAYLYVLVCVTVMSLLSLYMDFFLMALQPYRALADRAAAAGQRN